MLITNSRILLSIVSFCIIINLNTSCKNVEDSTKDTTNLKWLSFHPDFSDISPEDHLFLLHLNEADSTFILHWFIYQTEGEKSLFCRMTFQDQYQVSDNTYILPETLTYNEVKLIPKKSIKYPLDHSPKFTFSKFKNNLTLYNKEIKLSKEIPQSEVEKIITSHTRWKGEKIQF